MPFFHSPCGKVLLEVDLFVDPADQIVHGALLRMNRSIQAEGTFGILKQDRNYKRIVRRGLDFVKLELYLVSIGHNLYKFYNKSLRSQTAA